VARYGYNPARLALLAGMKSALDALRSAGCRRVYIDGSFVSTKELPGDYDGCWEALGMDLTSLDPVLLTFTQRRLAQKAKYGGEFFPAEVSADHSGLALLTSFSGTSRPAMQKASWHSI
jgi:hypothetical protein